MVYDKNLIDKKLNRLLETEIKTILNDSEYSDYSKIKNNPKHKIQIKKIKKEHIEDIKEFSKKHKIKDIQKLKECMKDKGSIIILTCESSKIIGISGKWDNCNTYPIDTIKGTRIGIYEANKGGFMDVDCKTVVKPIYSDIGNISEPIIAINEKYFWVSKGGEYQYGLISSNGKKITPFEFFTSGKKFFKFNIKEHILVKTKNMERVYAIGDKKYITPEIYNLKVTINEKMKSITIKDKNNKYGIIKDGKNITPIIYDQINIISENVYQVTENKLIGLIDSQGIEIIPSEYLKILSFDQKTSKMRILDIHNKTKNINIRK